MSKTHIKFSEQKSRNMIVTMPVGLIQSYETKLNELLEQGWLIEKTEIVCDTYVVTLNRNFKVFYIDVAHMPIEEVPAYLEHVKDAMHEGDDYYVPVR